MEGIDFVALLTGPSGGVVAFGIGTGFAVGYNFAQRTALKAAIERTAEWKREAEKWRDEYIRLTGKK